MKRVLQQILLVSLPILLMAFVVPSCKSPPEVIAYKTIGTQVITVESAKKAVADAYVAGQVSEKDFQTARAISDRYDAAVKVEQDAVLSYRSGNTNGLSAAMLAVTASSSDLMTLILKLLPQDRVAKLRGL